MIEEQEWRSVPSVARDARVAAPAEPTLVVGVSAENGALEALKALFIALDESAGMAFVVLPEREWGQRDREGGAAADLLLERLAQLTELGVRKMKSGDRLEADHVFVAPAGAVVEIDGGAVALRHSIPSPDAPSRLDVLFASLASEYGSRAVGILLSSTSVEGIQGAQAIAEAGGLTIASEASPVSESDAIEQVLSPFEIPEVLLARTAELPVFSSTRSPEDLAETVDELELVNAELRRLNRELTAIHGQLHADIQELHDAIEELDERHFALMRKHSAVSSALSQTPLAVLFLDEALTLRGFSGDVTSLYPLAESDIGSPLSIFEDRLGDMPMPPLPDLEELRAENRAHEDDVVTRDRWYLRRTQPHFTPDGQADGWVITFLDVTKLKLSEASARPHEAWLRAITDTRPPIISFVDDSESQLEHTELPDELRAESAEE